MEEIGRAMRDAQAIGALLDTRAANGSGDASSCPLSLTAQENLYLTTLAEFVEMLGGQLEVRAVFPDKTVTLTVPTRETPEETDTPRPVPATGRSVAEDEPSAPAST
jgi:hypothetical protein